MLEEILRRNKDRIGRVISFDLNKEKIFVFDFTEDNEELRKIDIRSAEEFDRCVKETLRLNNAAVGIGRYNEDRTIYRHSSLFAERTIHLGIDVILPAGTKIFSPLDAAVHSFHNNRGHGDYGPTIILQHELGGTVFYTLYGHLSEESLEGRKEGQEIQMGEAIGEIGNFSVNGQWFEHLHFQVIADMHGMKGDFPGVASIEQREKYLKLCPDPNLILRIEKLQM
ncbi:MAG: peptidoglycan DD-metalloendopeptidase family protein [Candidatus Aenigmarchaeota archaeon]|nr:peptidoglycan DD-metalloendopeptidase family protein [Candidatus Aenigmarchaeota archaeon]